MALFCLCLAAAPPPPPVIFDTDMGNDVDDAIALAVLHALQTRGECRLAAVTITKDNRWAPVFVSLMNTFYGRPEIPIGIVKGGVTPEDGNYNRQVAQLTATDGEPLFPRRLSDTSSVPDAVQVLRRALVAEPDGSVLIVQVGFSTNLARLLDSPPDSVSPLSGRELAARKVRLLSVMGGHFTDPAFAEYNIKMDVPSAQKLFAGWPGPIVAGGYEIGISIQYDPARLESDFRWIADHPLVHAYRFYRKMPYREPLWDPASALYAVRPEAGYFALSESGTVTFTAEGATRFLPSKDGKHRYLTANEAQRAAVREAISMLASEPR
ncbi:MAG: nucleoside hydrolase [Bryobacteraceae bacterium]|nr:nucleoside hydrolase [Bryobacteraceae bacterium]